MIDTSETKAAFFADWGEPAVYSQAGELPAAISVVFDTHYMPVNFAAGVVESAKPAAIADTDDVSDAQHDETLEIRGVTYVITNVQHSPEDLGEGFTRFLLKKA